MQIGTRLQRVPFLLRSLGERTNDTNDPSKNTNDAASPSWTFTDNSPEKKQGEAVAFWEGVALWVTRTYVYTSIYVYTHLYVYVCLLSTNHAFVVRQEWNHLIPHLVANAAVLSRYILYYI